MEFPETKTALLAQAAEGDWQPFFEEYLWPVWEQTVIACRARGINLSDAEEVFQELVLRLLREGRFHCATLEHLPEGAEQHAVPGNLAARYLRFRELGLGSTRFRFYLKAVIRNLVLENLRRQRPSIPLPSREPSAQTAWVGDSVSMLLDRQWAVSCLAEAARQFREECDRARTKGRRRLFTVLYLTVVEGSPQSQIAGREALDRSTVSGLLREARGRYLSTLRRVTGLSDKDLADLLREMPHELRESFRSASATSLRERSSQ